MHATITNCSDNDWASRALLEENIDVD